MLESISFVVPTLLDNVMLIITIFAFGPVRCRVHLKDSAVLGPTCISTTDLRNMAMSSVKGISS